MTKTFAQAVAFALATLVTAATFIGANAIAGREFVKADASEASHMRVLADQTVVVTDYRA
jgi:uncharacterized protein YbjQ (UPF0145 family)